MSVVGIITAAHHVPSKGWLAPCDDTMALRMILVQPLHYGRDETDLELAGHVQGSVDFRQRTSESCYGVSDARGMRKRVLPRWRS